MSRLRYLRCPAHPPREEIIDFPVNALHALAEFTTRLLDELDRFA